jgi:hypothetical protein
VLTASLPPLQDPEAISQLLQHKKMLDAGIYTQDEFTRMKTETLAESMRRSSLKHAREEREEEERVNAKRQRAGLGPLSSGAGASVQLEEVSGKAGKDPEDSDSDIEESAFSRPKQGLAAAVKQERVAPIGGAALDGKKKAAAAVKKERAPQHSKAKAAAESALPCEEGWSRTGHPWIGRRVRLGVYAGSGSARRLTQRIDSTITRFAAQDGADEALWHVVHDDGDEEDLNEEGVREGLVPLPGAPEPRVLSRHEKNEKRLALKAAAEAEKVRKVLADPTRAHQLAGSSSISARPVVPKQEGKAKGVSGGGGGGRSGAYGGHDWQTAGHEWIGRKVRRLILGKYWDGTVTRWAPQHGQDPSLWHLAHTDGDEEDLDEKEMQRGLALYAPVQKQLAQQALRAQQARQQAQQREEARLRELQRQRAEREAQERVLAAMPPQTFATLGPHGSAPAQLQQLRNIDCASNRPLVSARCWRPGDTPVPETRKVAGASACRKDSLGKLGGYVDLRFALTAEGKRLGLAALHAKSYGAAHAYNYNPTEGYRNGYRAAAADQLRQDVLAFDGHRGANCAGAAALYYWITYGWLESAEQEGQGAPDQLVLLDALRGLADADSNDFGDRCIHSSAFLPPDGEAAGPAGFTVRLFVWFRKSLFGLSAHETIRIMMAALVPAAQVQPTRQPPASTGSLLPSPSAPNAEAAGYDFTLPAVLRAAESTGFPVVSPKQEGKGKGQGGGGGGGGGGGDGGGGHVDGLSVSLREYQRQAVHWMLEQEDTSTASGVGGLNGYFWERREWADGQGEFFYFPLSGQLMLERPPLTTGGLLAEEMGLGKTVEVLALVLSNPRSPCSGAGTAGKWGSRATLIVVPPSLLSQWADELSSKAPGLKVQVHCTL